MKKESMRQLRETADSLVEEKVDTREKLETALPVLIDLQERIALSWKTLRAATAAAKKLSEQCTKYAVGHESAFDGHEMHLSQQGVKTGNLTIDDVTYHLSCGYNGYERIDGGMLRQDFLKALPTGWFKSIAELDVTKINDLNPSDEVLAEAGLRQKPNNVWSVDDK